MDTTPSSTCTECSKPFESSRKMHVDLAYCKTCRKKHSKDILEFVTSDSFKIFTIDQTEEAESLLSELQSDLRLDLHKTLDTIPIDTKLPDKTCCLSYVGQLTATRISAREEIQERIKSGQLCFGALVFARGSRKNIEACNRFTDVGSKAWFNMFVKSDKALFIDDSDDHVLSVESVGIHSIQIYPDQRLLELIGKSEYKDDSSSDSLFG